jgi:ABC-type branched-subunit amino acid transport system ATPase component
MALLLRTAGLCKRFGGVQAVQGVGFSLDEGEILAVIGPNGAGKSTLMNLLSGVYQPDAGSLELTGHSLIGLAPHRRARLGLARTFQKIRLFRQLSLLDNVLAGCHLHHQIPFWQYALPAGRFWSDWRRSREEALRLLDFVGLAERAQERAGALSYGEQRLLEIARALATRPRLFLLDEPAAGLNATEVGFLLQRLREIRARGIALVVVEHNMDLVMRLADRVFVVDHGVPLFEGPPAAVQRDARVIEAYLGVDAQGAGPVAQGAGSVAQGPLS